MGENGWPDTVAGWALFVVQCIAILFISIIVCIFRTAITGK